MSSAEEIREKCFVVVCVRYGDDVDEDVIYFLQYDGNEADIDNLVNAIKKAAGESSWACGQNGSAKFETEGQMVPESVVDAMCQLRLGNTFDKFQKCEGRYTDEPIDYENMTP